MPDLTGPGNLVQVEVAYALPDRQYLVALELPSPVTAGEAIRRSGLLEMIPGLDIESMEIGIFSRPAKLDAPLAQGDRVEIYRPLEVDPKEARRLRAAAKKNKAREAQG